MIYYPLFLDLNGKPVVVVGAGKVGLRKTKALLEAGARVTVVSPSCAAEFEALPVKLIRRAFRLSDIGDAYLAYAATNCREVNQRVAREAKRLRVPVNVADDPLTAVVRGLGFLLDNQALLKEVAVPSTNVDSGVKI